MPLTADAVQAWYTKRIHDFHYKRYLAYRGYTETGETYVKDEAAAAADVSPEGNDLSDSVKRLEREALPEAMREAYDFYWQNFNEADLGSVGVYVVPVDGENTYAIRVTTDGDDGYLEVYSEQGEFLAGARTELDAMAWGTRESLREQVANHGEFTPEMKEAKAKSFWGKPLPWDCQVVCWQCQAAGRTGCCLCKQGHRTTTGELHCCSRHHTWDDRPPDPRIFAKPRFELRFTSDRASMWSQMPPNPPEAVTGLKGTLPDYELTFQTRFGPITVFVADLEKIEFAQANSFELTRQIALAIHRLGGGEADAAEAELLGIGARAYPALVAAAGTGTSPISLRAGAIAARIQETTPAEYLNLRREHVVTAKGGQFSAAVTPDDPTFRFVTDEGCQSFELTNLRSLTQLPGTSVDPIQPDTRWLEQVCATWYGARLSFVVTGNAADGNVFGSSPYTTESMLAAAAVHAGRVKEGETKVLRVEIMLAPPSFVGSTQNGVTSLDWNEPVTGAFRFID